MIRWNGRFVVGGGDRRRINIWFVVIVVNFLFRFIVFDRHDGCWLCLWLLKESMQSTISSLGYGRRSLYETTNSAMSPCHNNRAGCCFSNGTAPTFRSFSVIREFHVRILFCQHRYDSLVRSVLDVSFSIHFFLLHLVIRHSQIPSEHPP